MNCCECHRPMKTVTQRGFGLRGDYELVTCENRDCPMCGFTLAAAEYPPANLDAYLESGWKVLGKQAAWKPYLESTKP